MNVRNFSQDQKSQDDSCETVLVRLLEYQNKIRSLPRVEFTLQIWQIRIRIPCLSKWTFVTVLNRKECGKIMFGLLKFLRTSELVLCIRIGEYFTACLKVTPIVNFPVCIRLMCTSWCRCKHHLLPTATSIQHRTSRDKIGTVEQLVDANCREFVLPAAARFAPARSAPAAEPTVALT